jgi:type IV secretory pathway VirJ component
LDDFVQHAREIIERVIQTHEAVVIEVGETDLVTLKPSGTTTDEGIVAVEPSAEDHAAFVSAAGGWADLDTDRLVDEIYARRVTVSSGGE